MRQQVFTDGTIVLLDQELMPPVVQDKGAAFIGARVIRNGVTLFQETEQARPDGQEFRDRLIAWFEIPDVSAAPGDAVRKIIAPHIPDFDGDVAAVDEERDNGRPAVVQIRFRLAAVGLEADERLRVPLGQPLVPATAVPVNSAIRS